MSEIVPYQITRKLVPNHYELVVRQSDGTTATTSVHVVSQATLDEIQRLNDSLPNAAEPTLVSKVFRALSNLWRLF